MPNFRGADAMREHMREGNLISLLEAILIFGVQGPNAELGRMKRDGFSIKSRRVPMTKILVRARLTGPTGALPPSDVPFQNTLRLIKNVELSQILRKTS